MKGLIIKKIRQNLHLSQYDFAKELDVSPSVVYLWENDKRRIGLKSQRKLLELMKNNNIKIDYLWETTNNEE